MTTVIAMASLGSRFGVARRLSVKKELIAFGYPSEMRGTPDRRVRGGASEGHQATWCV